MRKGKEYYTKKYKKAKELHKQGLSIKKIAKKLNVSYSAAYAWIKKNRKPKKGQLVKFIEFLKENGPQTKPQLKKEFPKYNELYHIAVKRKKKVKRKILDPKYKQFRTWYYLKGQEKKLEKRINKLKQKYKQLKAKLLEALD